MSQAEFYRGIEAAQAALAALAKSGSTAPSVQAAAVHDAMAPLFDRTSQSPQRACRQGCAHCCHLPVGITFGEAVRLATAVAALPAVRERVLAQAAGAATLSWAQLVGRACPLLEDNVCVVHAARPLPCRALASSDADACARAVVGPANVPIDDEAFWRGIGAVSVLAQASAPTGSRELRAALQAILTRPDEPGLAFTTARLVGSEAAEPRAARP